MASSTHEYRPPGEDISGVYRYAGPWGCPVCGGISWRPYRCDAPVEGGTCGADLTERGINEVRFDPGVTD